MPNQSDIQWDFSKKVGNEIIKDMDIKQAIHLLESNGYKVETPKFQDEILSKVCKLEEDMCVKALDKHLGRNATIEDYKDCQRVFRAGIDYEYTLCHKNVPLGYVKRAFFSTELNVSFTPII